jgi:hypothetical protein
MRNKIILVFFAILFIHCDTLSKSKKKYSKKIRVKKGKRGFSVFARMPAIVNIPVKKTSQEKKNIGLIESLTALEEYKKVLEGEQSSYAQKLKEAGEALEEVKKQTEVIKTKETETPPQQSESKITGTAHSDDSNDDGDDDSDA